MASSLKITNDYVEKVNYNDVKYFLFLDNLNIRKLMLIYKIHNWFGYVIINNGLKYKIIINR